MSAQLSVAAVQMVSGSVVSDNLRQAHEAVTAAAGAGAQLVALPEFFALMGLSDHDKVAAREAPGAGPMQDALAAWAARERIWLVAGSVPLACADRTRVRNACLVYGPDGRLHARYDKVHLFGFKQGDEQYQEARTIEPGRTPGLVLVEVAGQRWRIGLGICYDLRFPEYFRALGLLDAIILPAAFTYTTGRVHWEVLLRSRAIENQCYVLAPAQGGWHDNGRRTWGQTLLIDPWGEVLAQCDQGEGVVAGVFGRSRLAEVRAQLPAWAHRVC